MDSDFTYTCTLQVEKYNNVEFGRCPRVFCQGQPVIPVGQSDIPRTNTVKLFCPKCQDIYHPKLMKHGSILYYYTYGNIHRLLHFP
jgi:hypothetical protein